MSHPGLQNIPGWPQVHLSVNILTREREAPFFHEKLTETNADSFGFPSNREQVLAGLSLGSQEREKRAVREKHTMPEAMKTMQN